MDDIVESYLLGIFSGYMATVNTDWNGEKYWNDYVERKDIDENIKNLLCVYFLKGTKNGQNCKRNPPVIDVVCLKESIPIYIELLKNGKLNE